METILYYKNENNYDQRLFFSETIRIAGSIKLLKKLRRELGEAQTFGIKFFTRYVF